MCIVQNSVCEFGCDDVAGKVVMFYNNKNKFQESVGGGKLMRLKSARSIIIQRSKNRIIKDVSQI